MPIPPRVSAKFAAVRSARVRGFAPIADRHAEILILGSMPGRASLLAGEYYAHAQNAFWRIVCELLQRDASGSYAERIRALKSARIALWDVLRSCRRAGSLDSMIECESQSANDFRSFFRAHARIALVVFNGAKAEDCYRRHVLGNLENDSISYARLPSTSPAHASMSYAEKLRAWRTIVVRNQTTRRCRASRTMPTQSMRS